MCFLRNSKRWACENYPCFRLFYFLTPCHAIRVQSCSPACGCKVQKHNLQSACVSRVTHYDSFPSVVTMLAMYGLLVNLSNCVVCILQYGLLVNLSNCVVCILQYGLLVKLSLCSHNTWFSQVQPFNGFLSSMVFWSTGRR